VIAIRVEDIAPNGYALARAIVRQRKTGRPVRFELTEQTHQAVDDYLKATGKVAGEFLFTPLIDAENLFRQSGPPLCPKPPLLLARARQRKLYF